MALSLLPPEFTIQRDSDLCIECGVCTRQCSFGGQNLDPEDGSISSDALVCVGCQRCVTLCPTGALTVLQRPTQGRHHPVWDQTTRNYLLKQAETGGMLLTGMGNDRPFPIYWDRLLLNASQVTNPSIDPLREPMELYTLLGAKPDRVEFDAQGRVLTQLAPQLRLELPVMFSAMSFGSISLNTARSLAEAAAESGTYFNTGEGGLHSSLRQFADHGIVQVASGRFGVTPDYLQVAAAVEIKIGQGAKPGIGGHLPGEKVSAEVSATGVMFCDSWRAMACTQVPSAVCITRSYHSDVGPTSQGRK